MRADEELARKFQEEEMKASGTNAAQMAAAFSNSNTRKTSNKTPSKSLAQGGVNAQSISHAKELLTASNTIKSHDPWAVSSSPKQVSNTLSSAPVASSTRTSTPITTPSPFPTTFDQPTNTQSPKPATTIQPNPLLNQSLLTPNLLTQPTLSQPSLLVQPTLPNPILNPLLTQNALLQTSLLATPPPMPSLATKPIGLPAPLIPAPSTNYNTYIPSKANTTMYSNNQFGMQPAPQTSFGGIVNAPATGQSLGLASVNPGLGANGLGNNGLGGMGSNILGSGLNTNLVGGLNTNSLGNGFGNNLGGGLGTNNLGGGLGTNNLGGGLGTNNLG
ncbi:hypothetical protein HK096_001012, partial [Nowakowskiella sp. JEL0078]